MDQIRLRQLLLDLEVLVGQYCLVVLVDLVVQYFLVGLEVLEDPRRWMLLLLDLVDLVVRYCLGDLEDLVGQSRLEDLVDQKRLRLLRLDLVVLVDQKRLRRLLLDLEVLVVRYCLEALVDLVGQLCLGVLVDQ